eukprot:2569858-Rhodomonas_salina.1
MLRLASGPMYCHCLLGRNVLRLSAYEAYRVSDRIAIRTPQILLVAGGTKKKTGTRCHARMENMEKIRTNS